MGAAEPGRPGKPDAAWSCASLSCGVPAGTGNLRHRHRPRRPSARASGDGRARASGEALMHEKADPGSRCQPECPPCVESSAHWQLQRGLSGWSWERAPYMGS